MLEMQEVRVDISEDRMSGWVHFPGWAYSDYGRTETLTPWALSKTFEGVRYFGLTRGMIEFTTLVNRFTGYFVLGGQYTVSQDFWKIPRTANIPFKASVEVQDIGKTSVTLFSRLISKLDGKRIATGAIKLVFVDRATSRPIPLPDWMLERYHAAIKNKQKLMLTQKAPEIPASAFQFRLTVKPSDTDVNRHTNQASYVRFCCDAAQLAVKVGKLPIFAPDIARFPIQSMEAVYTGESNYGDSLCVYVWQKDDQPGFLYCVITREKDNKPTPIFHMYMLYGLTPIRVSKL